MIYSTYLFMGMSSNLQMVVAVPRPLPGFHSPNCRLLLYKQNFLENRVKHQANKENIHIISLLFL